MYKSELKKWDISKSFKAQEILAILHAMESRPSDGSFVQSQSQVALNGQEVDLRWVRHYIRRNRARMKLDVGGGRSEGSPTTTGTGSGDEYPPMPRVLAPRPTPALAAPGALQTAEELVRAMKAYVQGAWAARKWYVDTRGVLRSRAGGDASRRLLLRLWNLWDEASTLMAQSAKVDLVHMLTPAFVYLDDIVRDDCPRGIPFLLAAFGVLHRRGRRDLVMLFVAYLASLSSVMLGPRHPQTRLWHYAKEVPAEDHDHVFHTYFSWLAEVLLQGKSPMSSCSFQKTVRRHSCGAGVAHNGLESHESRLQLHIRLVERESRRSAVAPRMGAKPGSSAAEGIYVG